MVGFGIVFCFHLNPEKMGCLARALTARRLFGLGTSELLVVREPSRAPAAPDLPRLTGAFLFPKRIRNENQPRSWVRRSSSLAPMLWKAWRRKPARQLAIWRKSQRRWTFCSWSSWLWTGLDRPLKKAWAKPTRQVALHKLSPKKICFTLNVHYIHLLLLRPSLLQRIGFLCFQGDNYFLPRSNMGVSWCFAVISLILQFFWYSGNTFAETVLLICLTLLDPLQCCWLGAKERSEGGWGHRRRGRDQREAKRREEMWGTQEIYANLWTSFEH